MIDLDFDTTDEAEGFLRFLKAKVCGTRENSPGLAGTAETMVLEPADLHR